MLRALIFDVDGTLADTEKDGHRVAFNQAFKTLGLDWQWDIPTYGRLLATTGGKERIKHYAAHYRPDFHPPENFDELVGELHRMKTAYYTNMLAQGSVPLRKGVSRLLSEARSNGLKLAIATTTTPANVAVLLKYSMDPHPENWFEVIGAGDVVAAKKPAPDIYHWVLQRLALAPQECFAFEDSENGLQSALSAGLKTLVTVNAYTQHQNFCGATAVLSDLGEPEHSFTVLQGDTNGQNHVNMELLRYWHDRHDAP